MKIYIGTKIIQAEPANQIVRIGHPIQAGYRVIYPGGYISWSPKEVFEAAYREVSTEEKDLLESDRREVEEGGE